jgi:hypothetical protein
MVTSIAEIPAAGNEVRCLRVKSFACSVCLGTESIQAAFEINL